MYIISALISLVPQEKKKLNPFNYAIFSEKYLNLTKNTSSTWSNCKCYPKIFPSFFFFKLLFIKKITPHPPVFFWMYFYIQVPLSVQIG